MIFLKTIIFSLSGDIVVILMLMSYFKFYNNLFSCDGQGVISQVVLCGQVLFIIYFFQSFQSLYQHLKCENPLGPVPHPTSYYAPNFKKIEGAYCFRLVCPFVTHTCTIFKNCACWSFEISHIWYIIWLQMIFELLIQTEITDQNHNLCLLYL